MVARGEKNNSDSGDGDGGGGGGVGVRHNHNATPDASCGPQLTPGTREVLHGAQSQVGEVWASKNKNKSPVDEYFRHTNIFFTFVSHQVNVRPPFSFFFTLFFFFLSLYPFSEPFFKRLQLIFDLCLFLAFVSFLSCCPYRCLYFEGLRFRCHFPFSFFFRGTC